MQGQLFDGRFGPTEHTVGFLEAPLDAVTKVVLNPTAVHFPMTSDPFQGALAEALNWALPHAYPRDRIVLMETRSSWTAYFDNGVRGTDANTVIPALSERNRWRGLRVTYARHTYDKKARQGEFGAVIFALYGAQVPRGKVNNLQRVVGVVYEDRWRFEAAGTPLDCEEQDRYSAPQIAQRFTLDDLLRCCRALQIEPFDPNFYGPGGTLIKIDSPSKHFPLANEAP